jgi:hypothetical protein
MDNTGERPSPDLMPLVVNAIPSSSWKSSASILLLIALNIILLATGFLLDDESAVSIAV